MCPYFLNYFNRISELSPRNQLLAHYYWDPLGAVIFPYSLEWIQIMYMAAISEQVGYILSTETSSYSH